MSEILIYHKIRVIAVNLQCYKYDPKMFLYGDINVIESFFIDFSKFFYNIV